MHRVFVEEIAALQAVQPLTAGEEEHLFRVLRARPGDRVGVMDGRGGVSDAVVQEDRSVVIVSRRQAEAPQIRLHLWCAAPRKAKLDEMLKQAAETGASSIRPVICERSVAKPEGSGRWLSLLQEACKQSGNPFLPELLPPLPFREALETARRKGFTLCYGALEQEPERPLPRESCDVVWLVGPEGGFSREEVHQLAAAGAYPVHLGPWILRLETAAVCGLAVLRRLVAALLIGCALLMMTAGCGRAEVRKHPLMVRADRCRAKDPARAETLYRELLARYPHAPELHLALASLYDEALNRPLAALYFYDECLRSAEAGREKRAAAAAGFKNVADRLVTELSPAVVAEKDYLKKENAALRRQLELQRNVIVSLHRQLQKLKQQKGDK